MSSSERLFGVIGSGTMGRGIAQAAATAGFHVKTLDTSPSLVESAYAEVEQRLDRRVEKGRMARIERDEIVSRLSIADGIDAFQEAECVVEAVPEKLELKREIFGELDAVVSDRTLLATNTSSLSIEKISAGLKHVDRFLGMHFFNPAPVMQLIELVSGSATSDQSIVDARAVCAKLDKTPVRVKDSPGFIGNRVNRPFYLEALHLLESGEADLASIDTAMKQVGGFKMGPFELLDLIGIDVNLSVTKTVFEDFDRPSRFHPNAIQQKLVDAGHYGRKTKRGFYDHSDGEPKPALESSARDVSGWKPSQALTAFAEQLEKPADRAMWIYARILLAVVNEGGRTADTIALPRDVDVAMQLGFNYPEGPLGIADYVGLDIVQDLMAESHAESGDSGRFEPNKLLDKRVADGDLGEKTARGFLYHAL